MSRFFLTSEDTLGKTEIGLVGENAHHLGRVLRAREGEKVTVCDGKGTDYFCLCKRFLKESVILEIEHSAPSETEYGPRITLYQCLAKGDKMGEIITRTTEMGLYRFVPVVSRNCVVKNEREDKKRERWQKIALSAAKQSARGLVPEIASVCSFKEAVAEMAKTDAFLCYEGETERDLSHIEVGEEISFLIGPEGGLAPEEATLAAAAGIPAITLGKRILRTENAATFVLPILQYKWRK